MVNSFKWIGMAAAAGAGLGCLALGGCAETPTGPTVVVWPSPGKPFAVFRAEDVACRQYAASVINPNATNNTAVKQAVIGTALGTAAGVLIGDSARGAGIGAGVGLLVGSAAGSNASERGNWSTQRQYNIAYEQCMYSQGNQIPGAPPVHYTPPPPPPGGGG